MTGRAVPYRLDPGIPCRAIDKNSAAAVCAVFPSASPIHALGRDISNPQGSLSDQRFVKQLAETPDATACPISSISGCGKQFWRESPLAVAEYVVGAH